MPLCLCEFMSNSYHIVIFAYDFSIFFLFEHFNQICVRLGSGSLWTYLTESTSHLTWLMFLLLCITKWVNQSPYGKSSVSLDVKNKISAVLAWRKANRWVNKSEKIRIIKKSFHSSGWRVTFIKCSYKKWEVEVLIVVSRSATALCLQTVESSQ